MFKITLLAFVFFTSAAYASQEEVNYQIRALSGEQMIKQSSQMYLDNELNLKADRTVDTHPWSAIIIKKIEIESSNVRR